MEQGASSAPSNKESGRDNNRGGRGRSGGMLAFDNGQYATNNPNNHRHGRGSAGSQPQQNRSAKVNTSGTPNSLVSPVSRQRADQLLHPTTQSSASFTRSGSTVGFMSQDIRYEASSPQNAFGSRTVMPQAHTAGGTNGDPSRMVQVSQEALSHIIARVKILEDGRTLMAKDNREARAEIAMLRTAHEATARKMQELTVEQQSMNSYMRDFEDGQEVLIRENQELRGAVALSRQREESLFHNTIASRGNNQSGGATEGSNLEHRQQDGLKVSTAAKSDDSDRGPGLAAPTGTSTNSRVPNTTSPHASANAESTAPVPRAPLTKGLSQVVSSDDPESTAASVFKQLTINIANSEVALTTQHESTAVFNEAAAAAKAREATEAFLHRIGDQPEEYDARAIYRQTGVSGLENSRWADGTPLALAADAEAAEEKCREQLEVEGQEAGGAANKQAGSWKRNEKGKRPEVQNKGRRNRRN